MKVDKMPIYMDVHIVPGVRARNVAEAHQQDLLHQEEYGCTCMTYWVDESRETVFCLIEAPTKEAVVEMHTKAHGLVPNKVIEVESNIVESFLGRIYDPQDAEVTTGGLKVFAEPSLRHLLVVSVEDPVLLRHQLGDEHATALLQQLQVGIKQSLLEGGRQVEHNGNYFLLSFTSACRAAHAALHIREHLDGKQKAALKLAMSISSGEPVAESNQLFGDTLRFAEALGYVSQDGCIAITLDFKELIAKDIFPQASRSFTVIAPQEEAFLKQLFSILEEHLEDAEFDLENYCLYMAMSQSQLYRKTMALTGFSPNQLMREYRLQHAREQLRRQRHSIAQVTFTSGFSSPSYFTKCFKKRFGILPNEYQDLLMQAPLAD